MTTQELEQLKRYEEDMNWITAHYEELKLRYPEEFVAVYRYSVVDHDREMRDLMTRLRKKFGEKANFLATEFITAKKDELIL